MKISKELRAEIRKQSVAHAFLWIGAALSAIAPTVKLWAARASLSATQAATIRQWLLFAGAASLIASAWILFVRTFRKLRLAEKQVQDSLGAPFRVSDDYEFDTEGGFWIERKTGLRVCAKCLLPPTKIVSPLFEGVGSGFEE